MCIRDRLGRALLCRRRSKWGENIEKLLAERKGEKKEESVCCDFCENVHTSSESEGGGELHGGLSKWSYIEVKYTSWKSKQFSGQMGRARVAAVCMWSFVAGVTFYFAFPRIRCNLIIGCVMCWRWFLDR